MSMLIGHLELWRVPGCTHPCLSLLICAICTVGMAVSSLQLHDCSYPLTRARTLHGNLLAILYHEGLAEALLSGTGMLSGALY
jgi:hypothetical protein